MVETQYAIYVLESLRNGRFYIGFSSDVEARLNSHNAGPVKATRSLRPWKLVYTEACVDATAARQRERKLKSMKSRVCIQSLTSSGG
jgi:putative endonuclease